MADNKRGRRSNDDEFDDEVEPVDDADLDDLLDSDDDDDVDDRDDDTAARPARSRAAVAKARAQGRDVKDRDKEKVGFGLFGRLIRFVREVVAELQKVIWPTRKELLTYTAVVVVFVAAVMSLVAGLDIGFAQLMLLVFGSQTST